MVLPTLTISYRLLRWAANVRSLPTGRICGVFPLLSCAKRRLLSFFCTRQLTTVWANVGNRSRKSKALTSLVLCSMPYMRYCELCLAHVLTNRATATRVVTIVVNRADALDELAIVSRIDMRVFIITELATPAPFYPNFLRRCACQPATRPLPIWVRNARDRYKHAGHWRPPTPARLYRLLHNRHSRLQKRYACHRVTMLLPAQHQHVRDRCRHAGHWRPPTPAPYDHRSPRRGACHRVTMALH